MKNMNELLSSGELCLGTWAQIASPEIIDLFGLNGFEFAIIDCEHGYFGLETAENLARACDAIGIAPAVRVPANDPVPIMKALDAGIRHVVVPGVASGEDAMRAVRATRFAPRGVRGACPCCRSGGHSVRNWKDYVSEEERRVGAIALVESKDGHENFADILATEELSAIMLGPFDLSVSLGHEGDWRHDAVMKPITEMVDAAIAAGRPIVMPVFSTDRSECRRMIDAWRDRGVTCFVLGSDKIIIAEAFHEWTSSVRSSTAASCDSDVRT